MAVITPESLARSIAYQKAHLDDDRSHHLYTTAGVIIVLPTIFVALRLACRRHLKAPFSHDDIAIVVALMEFAIELTYCVLITTIKFSILLFYRRVFINHTTSTWFRVAWYIITVWCFLWGVSTFIAAVFQCTPVSYLWTQFSGKTKGKCVDFTALLIATAAVNIFTDVAVLVLPMPMVWKMKIEKAQKLAVSGIFLLGGL
ncbi:MAG: hypothetical protein LQ348_004886 [Seirophora lacunosa]|nr:MAG: hypothetical protein LQ348_004886 [Seirophora lacunosa]